MTPAVNSESVGDPRRFRSVAALDAGLHALPSAPLQVGKVWLLVRRGEGGERTELARARLTPASGMPGDAWGRRPTPKPEGQLTVMQRDVAMLIAHGQPLTLFGDNLFVDLDLSAANLPVGTRLRLGTAILVVTPKPHNGCKKFAARFGPAALRWTARESTRHRNWRGVYMRVVRAGDVAVGDAVRVLARNPRPDSAADADLGCNPRS